LAKVIAKNEMSRFFMVQCVYGGTENARLENTAPNYRTGKREKRHVWKAKLRTPHVVVILVWC